MDNFETTSRSADYRSLTSQGAKEREDADVTINGQKLSPLLKRSFGTKVGAGSSAADQRSDSSDARLDHLVELEIERGYWQKVAADGKAEADAFAARLRAYHDGGHLVKTGQP